MRQYKNRTRKTGSNEVVTKLEEGEREIRPEELQEQEKIILPIEEKKD